MDIKHLHKLGLSTNETKVYLTLLERGELKAGQVSNISKVNRTNTYDAIRRLSEKGLVSSIVKKKVKLFQASDPRKLLDILEQKQRKLKDDKEKLAELLPELQARKRVHIGIEAKVFTGKNGVVTVLQDVLTAKTVYVTGAKAGAFEAIFPRYYKIWQSKRVQRKTMFKVLLPEQKRSRELKKWPFRKVRYLPSKFSAPTSTWLYSNKVVHFIWDTEPSAIMIVNKKLFRSYKEFFEVMWLSAKH